MSLRQQLAAHGFESNDDYDFVLRCLFEARQEHLRVLHVDGRGGRRRTAFANALAHALDYPHILYHDFLAPEPAHPAPAPSPDDEAGPPDKPVSAFERAVTEACAYSEGERTILILDQLQAADFADHLRLYRLASERRWNGPTGTVSANPRNLLLALISDEPLYHSLARLAFRVWTDIGRGYLGYRPEDFGLDRDAQPLFDALGRLFEAIEASPTPSAYTRLLDDLLRRVRSEEQLRQSLFGWIENLDRDRVAAPSTRPLLADVIAELERLVGIEHIEL